MTALKELGDGYTMITLKIEFINEIDRKALIEHLNERYVIVEFGKIKNSPRENSIKKYQYLEIIPKKKRNADDWGRLE